MSWRKHGQRAQRDSPRKGSDVDQQARHALLQGALERRNPGIDKPITQPCAEPGDTDARHQANQGGEPVTGRAPMSGPALTGPMKALT
jgi:hypothetical protein